MTWSDLQAAVARMSSALLSFGDAISQVMGYQTRAEREMQRRIERHMTRCAMRRERRRKGRK